MTFDDAAVELKSALKAQQVAAEPKKKNHVLQIVRDTCALIALVAFALAIVDERHQSSLVHVASVQTQCINRILSDRNGTAASDERAHSAYALQSLEYQNSLLALVTISPTSTVAERQPTIAAFVAESKAYSVQTQQYAQILQANQDFRAAHPLGQC